MNRINRYVIQKFSTTMGDLEGSFDKVNRLAVVAVHRQDR